MIMKTLHTIYTNFAKRLALVLTLLTLGVTTAWAAEETVDFSQQGYGNGNAVSSYTGTGFSVSFTAGTNSNAPKYYSSGSAIRCYGGNKFTVTSTSNITKIVITFGSSDGSNAISTNVGIYSSGTWSGTSKSIEFTIGGSSGNRRIQKLTVTYDSGYTITYNTNGGTAVSSTTGTKLPNPLPTTTKTGYTFAGWYTNSALTAAATAGATINADITLYAKWTANKYTVKFNGNGNTDGSMNDQSFTYDVAQDLTANAFEKFGHTFDGWSKTSNGSVEYTDGQSVSNLTSTNNGTVTLYAKWTEKALTDYRTSCSEETTLSVTYDANGATSGSVPVDNTEYEIDAQVTVLDNTGTLAKTGHTFNGWNTKAGGNGTPYTAGATFTITENTTLYAQWNAIPTYTVSFDTNGHGDAPEAQTVEENTTASEPTAPTATGYTFGGWYTDQACSDDKKYNFTTPVTEDITLYAKWTINQYIVTLHPNYPNGKTGTFIDKEGNTINGNLVLTYDYYTASQTLTDLYQSIKLDGYRFDGWYTAKGASDGTVSGSKWSETKIITSDLNFYAKWTEVDCRWIETDIANILPEDEVLVTMKTPLEGKTYTLDYSEGTSTYPPAKLIEIVGNEAKFLVPYHSNSIWNISGDAINGYILRPNGDSRNALYCTASTYNVKVGTNADNTFIIDGGYLKNMTHNVYVGVYNSSDWRHYPANTGNAIAGQTLKFYKRVCVDESNPWYTVTFNAGSGLCDTESLTGTKNEGITLPTATPSDACQTKGWTFAGWANASVATETEDAPTTLYEADNTYKPTSNITLHAVYKRTEEGEGGGSTPTEVSKIYTFSDYEEGEQYAEETYELDDDVTINIKGCHINTQLRVYGVQPGIVISEELPGRIVSMGFNMGYKEDALVVSGSTDGSSWTEVDKISTTTSYKEYTLDFGETNYTYFKLNVEGSSQIRIASMSITWESTSAGGNSSTTYYHSTPDCGDPCEQLGAATGLTVETDFVHTDGQTYVKFSWTPADNTKNYATSQKICFGKVDEAGTCVDDLAKNQTWTGDLKSKLEPGEYWWSIQALGEGNYCDGDVVNGTNFTIEAPTYTVTFNAGSGTCDDESLTETSGGAGVTLPTANPPAACATDGWKFAGWWTGSVAETTTSPGELLAAGSNYKPTTNCTLYAVYSHTEAGGGGSGFYLSVTKDATTYYIGEKGSGSYLSAVTDVNSAATFNIESNQYLYYGNKTYVSSTSDNTSLTIATTTPSATWAITDEGETITFKSNGTGGRYLAFNYNSGSPRFSSYNSTYTYELTKHTTSTTTYNSNPTCLEPVWETNAATIDKTSFTVNCGERSPMTGPNGAAIISFPTEDIYNFTKDITIEATTGFLVSTSQSVDANYQSSVSLSPLVGTTNANTFYNKFVYVRAEAPAMSEENLSGTITIKNNKGETLQTFSVTADVTCNKCTVQFVDRGANYQEPILLYAGQTIDEAPADPEGVCTDPIHYVFDGWATATVAAGSTTYTKVTFPYIVEGNTKFYAVYRYVEEGSGDSGDYVKVTDDLDDYSGDYLFVYETGNVAFDGGRNNVDDELDATSNTIEVTINGNTIASNATTDAAKFTIAKVDGGYSIQSASGYYIGRSATSNGLNANETYSANYDLNTITNYKTIKGKGGNILKYNKDSDQKRFRYYKSGQEDIALYRKAASYLYTTSPICGPHLAITEGKDIYVTGGNAGGTRDLVIAQQKVSYKATRLQTNNGLVDGTAPDVKVATNGITVGGVVTQDVKVTIDQTKEQQTDGTYTITGTITVQYQPSANNKQEDIQVQLAVDYNAEARDNFTVHARSLPAEFVIVAKSGDKWYALNGDMNTNAANPANGQVTLDNADNPTKATYAPCNAIYTFDGLPNTGDRTYVRFQGTDGAWLWASSGTNVGIQNNVLKTTPEGNNNAYNWKLYTQDNITYQFGNANSNRQLTLNGEKFGMYASGVQDIRILPYDEKCLYNYAPSNLKVSVLKGTYVTLTWDAVVGATKYQYSTDATNWNDAGTEPTVTINGLTGDTKYTYYIRAYHEDTGVSQECIDYAEITFTTANCDDVPSDITCSADMTSITVTWTADAATSTVTLYSDAEGTAAVETQTNVANYSTIFTELTKNTQYYVQVLAGGTCASPIIPVKTEDVEVDIVEWMTDGIIVDINTDETVGVTLENEVSYGSGLGTEATELFFSKYYEASYNVKLVAIYNGTKNIIDLTDYTIQYGKTSWESNYITLKDFGATKGQIQPGEEIILYSYTENSADDKKILDCVHNAYPDGNWVRVTSTNNDGNGTLSFGGDKTIILCKTEYDDEADEYYDNIIDVIGALKEDPNEGILPTNENTEKPSWGDKEGWVCETGLSIADDSQIGISTNRCLLIRNNTVTSGDNAVASNMNNFVTLCTEWKGAHVPDNDIDNGVQASCDNFAYVGTFDYSDYYTKYEEMPGGTSEFDENDRNPDGTVTISIPDLYKRACSNIRVKLTNSDGEVLTDREYKVPIMITTDQATAYTEANKDDNAFYALQENLATVEVDGDGNIIATHRLSLDEVREICKTCDVVIRDNATLTKALDDDTNDHPQVNNVMIYEGASLEIPSGADYNYTINSLSLRRKGDIVASAKVEEGGKLHLPASATAPIYLDMRIDANNWHWFTLPYNCNIEDVTWVDGTPAQYNKDWFIMYYDGNSRANEQSIYENHWKVYNGTTIEAGKGYIVGIQGDITHPDYTFELRFPMTTEVLTNEHTDKTVAVNAWGVKMDITPNKKGWNLVGNPYLDYYKTSENISFTGLSLIEYLGINPVTGERLYQEGGNVPFLVTPIDGGWYEYRQELASDIEMMPFTAYFVQVGDPNNPDYTDGMELHAQFESDHRGRMSLIRRAPQEVDGEQEPVIVRVEVANAKGESDKTTLIIDDRFTNEYEMNGDFFKWFGDYYRRYTKPVLYSMGADHGKRAFNALSEQLAAQPVALGMFAAQAGDYTFSLTRKRCDLSRVEEVWLYDATTATYTNLMQQDYTFTTAKTEGEGRFYLSVKMRQNAPTDITDIYGGNIVASAKDGQIIVGGLTDNTQLWIYDATGKLLHTEHTTNFQHVYDVPVVGTYFVRTQGAGQAQTIKVLVE